MQKLRLKEERNQKGLYGYGNFRRSEVSKMGSEISTKSKKKAFQGVHLVSVGGRRLHSSETLGATPLRWERR